MMSVGIVGLWHLGCVTAACIADAGYPTIGIDTDLAVIASLQEGRAPLFEPYLDDLIRRGIDRRNLTFSSSLSVAAECDLVWVTIDTPVDDNDVANTEFVRAAIEMVFPHLKDGAVLLISSQLPVGSTRAIMKAFSTRYPQKACHFAYSPENLQLGKAIESFKSSERIIVGCENDRVRQILQPLLQKFTQQLVWLSIEIR